VDATQWHKVLQMTFEMVNTFPDTADICRKLVAIRPQYEIRGKPEYDYALEFSSEGITYQPGKSPKANVRFDYPNLNIAIETLTAQLPSVGSHPAVYGVHIYGNQTYAITLVALTTGISGAFLTAMDEIGIGDKD